MPLTIDTLAYVKELAATGVERAVAEAQVRALAEHALPDVATKADLERAIADLERGIERVQHQIELVRRDVTIWLGSMIVVATGVLLAARYLGHG